MLAYSKSTLQHINGIDVIHLNEDTPFETGYAFGRLLMLSENAMAAFFRSRIVGVILRCLSFFSRRYLNRVELPDRYQAEIAGCAVATEIPYQNVLFLNVCFDLSKKIGWYCSTFTFFNDQKILVGTEYRFQAGYRPVASEVVATAGGWCQDTRMSSLFSRLFSTVYGSSQWFQLERHGC